MKQNIFKKIPLSGPILTGMFLIVGLVSLFSYISAKEVTEMPKWPEYFQSGLRLPNHPEGGTISKDQVDTENASKITLCPDGNCEVNTRPAGLVSSSSEWNVETFPASEEPIQTSSDLSSRQQGSQELVATSPSTGAVKGLVEDSDKSGGMAIPFSEDPITREMENELIATGLLSRHAEITESIFLMEQQLKQAQLIIGLMEILGPDIPIEISPGVFKNFRNTPAGNKIASEMAVETLESRAEIFDLEMKVLTARKKIENAMNPLHSIAEYQAAKELETSDPLPRHEPILREIIGGEGNLQAIFSIGDKIVSFKRGDNLPTGEEVIQITREFVELEQGGQTIMFRIR